MAEQWTFVFSKSTLKTRAEGALKADVPLLRTFIKIGSSKKEYTSRYSTEEGKFSTSVDLMLVVKGIPDATKKTAVVTEVHDARKVLDEIALMK